MARIALIVPAAGKSERFGGKEKKPFAKLDNRPILIRTLEAFVNRDDVCEILVAVASEDLEFVRTRLGPNLAFMNARLVEGGARRCDSVAAALKEVAEDAEYVAIHDAARPCVSSAMIDAVFAEAQKTGAAILAAPLTGTLKRVADSMIIDETVSRVSLFEAQTPQVFRRDLLVKAYEQMDAAAPDPTDDAELVERAGHPVSVVASDASNLKITRPSDLPLAGAIIRARPQKRVPKLGAFEEAQW